MCVCVRVIEISLFLDITTKEISYTRTQLVKLAPVLIMNLAQLS